uniref:Uncharacterized protein n=1 Tax=Setaria viridis TaxID=4556 RepID=A0A4U6TJ13_SETVI|nr:hypothetical protein SEVIR_8G118950v2 [Setaria viridis]
MTSQFANLARKNTCTAVQVIAYGYVELNQA